MPDKPLQRPANAVGSEPDIETRLLYAAYKRKPLNLLMTFGAMIVMAGLLWEHLPRPGRRLQVQCNS